MSPAGCQAGEGNGRNGDRITIRCSLIADRCPVPRKPCSNSCHFPAWACPRSVRRGSNCRVTAGQFHEQFRRAKFLKPEPDLRCFGFGAVLKIMRFDQAADHWPVLIALGFLSAHQVGQGKQVACLADAFSLRKLESTLG